MLLVGEDLLDPEDFPDGLGLLVDLLRQRLRLVVAVIPHGPIHIFLSLAGDAVDLALLLGAAAGTALAPSSSFVPIVVALLGELLFDPIAAMAPGQLTREELLRNPIPLDAEFLRTIRRGDEDRMLDHVEDVGIGAPEVLPPVIQAPWFRHHLGAPQRIEEDRQGSQRDGRWDSQAGLSILAGGDPGRKSVNPARHSWIIRNGGKETPTNGRLSLFFLP